MSGANNKPNEPQTVADAGGVTARDRRAMVDYENARPIPLNAEFAKDIVAGVYDSDSRVQAFAAHRLQSVAAATAAKDAAFLEAAQLVFCIEAAGAIEFEGENFTRWKEKARSIAPLLRAALSEAREAGAKD